MKKMDDVSLSCAFIIIKMVQMPLWLFYEPQHKTSAFLTTGNMKMV